LTNKSTILCSLHSQRKSYTAEIFLKNYSAINIHIFASDKLSNGDTVPLVMSQQLNKVKGVLEYNLVLQKNCPVIITKTSNFDDGLVNGTSGLYIDHSDQIMLIQTVNGRLTLPKVKQKIVLNEISYYRYQFPVIVSNCITVHRVQGSTLNKSTHILLDSTFFQTDKDYIRLCKTTWNYEKLSTIQVPVFKANKHSNLYSKITK